MGEGRVRKKLREYSARGFKRLRLHCFYLDVEELGTLVDVKMGLARSEVVNMQLPFGAFSL